MKRSALYVMLCGCLATLHSRPLPPPAGPVRVGVIAFADAPTSASEKVLAALSASPRLRCSSITVDRLSELGECDVVVIPGGSARRQSRELGESGRAALVDFVRRGGGYVGICAGAFLALSEDDMLALVDAPREDFAAKVAVDGWGEVQAGMRKGGPVVIDVSGDKPANFAPDMDACEMTYGGGPVFTFEERTVAGGNAAIAILGRYQTETVSFAFQRGTMIHTPAITFSRYHGGKVVLFSPHPEWTEPGRLLLIDAVSLVARWASSRSGFSLPRIRGLPEVVAQVNLPLVMGFVPA